jgi:hypothetical protein
MIEFKQEINGYNQSLHSQITFFGLFQVYVQVEVNSYRCELGTENGLFYDCKEPFYRFRLNVPYISSVTCFSYLGDKKDIQGFLWCSFWAVFFYIVPSLIINFNNH